MTRSATKEWFTILDDGLRAIGPRGYEDPTSAILAADAQQPWPSYSGGIVVRSNRSGDGVRVSDGGGRVAAIREGGRWSGPEVEAGRGYPVDLATDAAHARRYNHPPEKASPAQLRREIARALGEGPGASRGRPRR